MSSTQCRVRSQLSNTFVDTTEYYKSLTYATTGKPPVHTIRAFGRYPCTIWPDRTSSPSLDKIDLKPQSSATLTLHSNEGCIFGTIKVGRFVGEIAALGTIHGAINHDPYFCCTSWEELYTAENQCVFEKVSPNLMAIYFLVDGAVVAYCKVSTEGGDVGDDITSGGCVWTSVIPFTLFDLWVLIPFNLSDFTRKMIKLLRLQWSWKTS